MAARMRDVAALAGVSPRTVSNVVRGYVHVHPDTRARVQRAIDELRYRPHAGARSLREGRTGIIALAVPEIAAPYFAELADHVQRRAAEHDLTLLIDQTGASRDRELLVLDGYRSNVIDGLILSPMAITLADLHEQELDIPVVLLGERISDSDVVHVAIDNVAAARAATHHLFQTGRRRIAAVGADVNAFDASPASRRLQGYLQAHADRGVDADPALSVPTGGWSRASGFAAVDRLLRDGPEVDALFCFNDVMALGAVRALTDHGVRIPEDVAVLGWDDIEEARYAVPSLTTVAPDKASIARTAVDRLLDRIAGEPAGTTEVVCDYSLVVRASTAGPAADGPDVPRPRPRPTP